MEATYLFKLVKNSSWDDEIESEDEPLIPLNGSLLGGNGDRMIPNPNHLDLTNHIVVPSYKVNNKSVYQEWTDGNMITHRDELRKRVEGSFTLLYTDLDEYQEFISFFNDALTDGYVQAKVYINNENRNVNVDIHMDFELADEMPFFGIKEVEGIEITISER